MPTLVVSDLHLGSALGGDVLRHEPARERLLAEAAGCERVVFLGDLLELREQPLSVVLEAAYPFFEALGEALGRGAEVIVVPGNHDHQLAAPLIEERRLDGGEPLGLEQRRPAGSDGPLGAIARRMPGVEVSLAYPGLWLREDVYATHGHYLDCHIAVPRVEVLGIHATRRLLRRELEFAAPADYEAVIAPLYAFTYQLAHAAAHGGRSVASDLSARVWARLNSHRPSLGSRALAGAVIPATVAALNRLGLGPFTSDLSGASLRDAGLRAMGEVVRRLGIEAEHVLFGHTHRAGPLPGEDWWPAGLVNTGSWVYEPAVLPGARGDSPYWPGTLVRLPERGAPELRNVLRDVAPEELRPW